MDRFEEISKEAFEKEMPDSSYTLLEIHLFLVLKDIYKQYANRKITKEQGTQLKNLASVQYSNHCKQDKLNKDISNERIASIRKTEHLRSQLRKELKSNDKNALNTAIKLIELYSMEYWEGVNLDEFE